MGTQDPKSLTEGRHDYLFRTDLRSHPNMPVDLIRNLRAGRVPLDQILLDPNNPRLLESRRTIRRIPDERISEKGIQDETFNKMMADENDVKLLMDSIAEIGFLPVDKIVVRPLAEGKFVVVEGNRRVTALKALQSEATSGERELDASLRETMAGIDVLVLGSAPESVDRDQWTLQGLRHLSGIKGWGLFQQAKAVEVLIDQVGLSPREASESVGLTVNRVNRLYRALGAFHQMQEDPDVGTKVQPDMFSYFEEIIKRPSLKDGFLGFEDEHRTFTNSENTQKFYSWILPDEELSNQKKIPRAIDVRFLEAIVASPDAMRVMQDPERSVYDAIRVARPSESFDWESSLREAIGALDDIPAADLESLSDEQKALISSVIEKARLRLEQASELAAPR